MSVVLLQQMGQILRRGFSFDGVNKDTLIGCGPNLRAWKVMRIKQTYIDFTNVRKNLNMQMKYGNKW